MRTQLGTLLVMLLLVPGLCLAEETPVVDEWSTSRIQTHSLAAGVLLAGGGVVLGQMARQDLFHARAATNVRESRFAADSARFHSTASNVLFALAGGALVWGLASGVLGMNVNAAGTFSF